MAIFTEPRHSGEFIISEAPDYISRDKITVASGQVLGAGAVVSGPDTAIVVYTNGAGATGVLLSAVDATDGAKEGVIIARTAEVNGFCLAFTSGMSDADKTAAMVDLEALGISVRWGVGFDETNWPT